MRWTPHYSNILGYWKFDQDFTAVIGPNFTPSGGGAAISQSIFKMGTGSANFDGTACATSTVAQSLPYTFPNTTFTVMAWVNTTANFYIITDGLGPGGGWSLDINAAGEAEAQAKDCTNHQFLTTTTGTLVNDGKWHVIVGVFQTDTTTISNIFTVYADGAQVTTGMVYGVATAYCNPASSYALALNARQAPSPINFSPGDTDEVPFGM